MKNPARPRCCFPLPLLLLCLLPLSAPADDFDACVARLSAQARDAGVSAATIDATLGRVRHQQPVVDADRRQPEFTDSFAAYLGRRVTEGRVARGRELLDEHRELLHRIAADYGVPPQYLLSFWALETNFGSYFGNIPVFASLTTLACDQRRSGYFTGELMTALRIADRGHIDIDDMVGSWAGAMGHTQFMPSVYLQYAVDGDGSGGVDLWNSIPDALTSAANFLRGIGWSPGMRWGREVGLPEGFDYSLAGRNRARPLDEWRRMGVTAAGGSALPRADVEASLLVPAGHRGPAFLVYDNFHVIMRWNRSEFFALTVGHLADRIAGSGPLHRSPPDDAPRLSRDQVRALQQALNERGFDSGTPDGILGPATRQAISAFQRERGEVADGQPDRDLLDALTVE